VGKNHRPGLGQDQRRAIAPRRDEMEQILNSVQRICLERCEQLFGMQLRFVRQPLLSDPLPVLQASTGDFALMEHDGALNFRHGLAIRAEQSD